MKHRKFTDRNLTYIGFPLGGIGAGMYNIEGNGSFSGFSIRNAPNTNLEPTMFSAITVKGEKNKSRVIEAPVPKYKIFGGALSQLQGKPKNELNITKANGSQGKAYGLPRFKSAEFFAEFPFANIELFDNNFPLNTSITAWSPFIPANTDGSSYPYAIVEYTFFNNTEENIDAVYYYNTMNFMAVENSGFYATKENNGFTISQEGVEERPWSQGHFSAFIDEENVKVNTALFRGGWFDTLTMLWNDIEAGRAVDNAYDGGAMVKVEHIPGGIVPGGSIALEFSLKPGEGKTIRLNTCWYVPDSSLRIGHDFEDKKDCETTCCGGKVDLSLERYKPWYTTKFASISEVRAHLANNVNHLYNESKKFSNAFYSMTLPSEIIEAIAANLTILKSPTILRQTDGRLWAWEGCCDSCGCCAGSCTHVWNYAQAICHLFPDLERSMRETEFIDSQDERGHQNFRASLPIGAVDHSFHAASDGQLGGIIKLYRDFLISGDTKWLKRYYKPAKASLDFCINSWDIARDGVLKEPHHNTYDIEFWGADGMCSSFYIAALTAMTEIGKVLGEDITEYAELAEKGNCYLNEKLYNGEYFYQEVEWLNLKTKLPEIGEEALNDCISPEAALLLKKFGPKYQYGTGCLSDGVLGYWMAMVGGLGIVGDKEKIKSHLNSIYKYNFKTDLSEHANPQRPGYCMGDESGLLLCTWPNGNKPALPFVYSDEVWTGIEYQVASHLIYMGETQKGLDIVKAARSRYDGSARNPYDEYECGHWYARALASYALIEAYTGVRYNAYTKTLNVSSQAGDFTSFLSTNTGYATVTIKGTEVSVDVVSGEIKIDRIVLN